jgi:hypothetical protein
MFREKECERLDVVHAKTRQQSKVWRKKGTELPYPWDEVKGNANRPFVRR